MDRKDNNLFAFRIGPRQRRELKQSPTNRPSRVLLSDGSRDCGGSGSSGDIIVTVEESQGSVQNVMEAIGRTNNYVFTTPPVLIKLARGGKAMFKDKGNPRFDEVRALFPIPSLTMHFVMSEASGVTFRRYGR